jgi:hypothetical protein
MVSGGQAQQHQIAGHDAAEHATEPGEAGDVRRARAKGQRSGEGGERHVTPLVRVGS